MAITLTYTFTPNTRILSSQVNANFSTLATRALDKTGDTMTGDLKFTDASFDIGKVGATRPRDIFLSRNLTIGGTTSFGGNIISNILFTDATYDIGAVGATRPRDLFLSRNAVVGGTLGVTGLATFSGGSTYVDQQLTRPELKDYAETSTAPTISAGTLVCDLETGNTFRVALNANITTLTISNPPATTKVGAFSIIFTADGTLRTVTWPAAVKWPGAVAPTLTSTNLKIDVYTFLTTDAGTSWYGFISGQNF